MGSTPEETIQLSDYEKIKDYERRLKAWEDMECFRKERNIEEDEEYLQALKDIVFNDPEADLTPISEEEWLELEFAA